MTQATDGEPKSARNPFIAFKPGRLKFLKAIAYFVKSLRFFDRTIVRRILLPIFVIYLAIYLGREYRQDVLIIDHLSTPKQFEEKGF